LSEIAANSLSSASEQIVPSVGALAGRKPRAVDRKEKLVISSRSESRLLITIVGKLDQVADCVSRMISLNAT